MDLFIKLTFFITMYPIIFLMYFLLRGAGEKTYCFGATLKPELRNDEKVKQIIAEYRKQLKGSMIILGIIPIVTFFIPYFSIEMTIWMAWILVVAFLPTVWFAVANRKIQNLKLERGWIEEYDTRYTELKTVGEARKVKLLHFLPPMIIGTIPTIIGFSHFKGYGYEVLAWVIATFTLCTYLFYVSAVWTDKQKISVISCDSDINLNFARAKKQVWKNFWLICIWVNTIFTWFLLGIMWDRKFVVIGTVVGSIIYTIIVIGIAICLIKKLQDIDKKYDTKKTIIDASDDDKNWIFGFIYYNKNDNHFMIQNRMGMGTTMNLAKPACMILEVVAFLLLLIIPISSVWMIMLEFTPMQVYVSEQTVICEHLNIEYEIPIEEIDHVTVLEDLPDLTKINGTGMEELYSGVFEVYREGICEVFLNPSNHLFLKLEVDEKIYYLSGIDDVSTKQLEDTIGKILGK